MPDETWGLVEAINALRADLALAMTDAGNEDIKFKVEPVEITLQVAVTKGADAKIGWRVLGVGAKYDSTRTHTMKVKLTPSVLGSDGKLRDLTVSEASELRPNFGENDSPPDN